MELELQIKEARDYAVEVHGNQMYGTHPYVVHLDKSYAVLIRFGIKDLETLQAILLHDSIEDTECTFEELTSKFGKPVAEIVYAVTDEPGQNRKERKAKTYPKIKANPKAILVKLGDRIANVEFSAESAHLQMYRKEHKDFSSNLKRSDDVLTDIERKMWSHLDSLLK